MLHEPISQGQPGRIAPPTQRPSDHAMDILQYSTAVLAIAVVVLLAAIR